MNERSPVFQDPAELTARGIIFMDSIDRYLWPFIALAVCISDDGRRMHQFVVDQSPRMNQNWGGTFSRRRNISWVQQQIQWIKDGN